jgi:hypothetical protein
MSKSFSQKQKKTIPMPVFLRLLIFYRVFGCFSAMGVQKHYKKRFAKNNVSKGFLQKNRPKIQNRFFSDFFNQVFGRFSVRGVQKHDKKYQQKI